MKRILTIACAVIVMVLPCAAQYEGYKPMVTPDKSWKISFYSWLTNEISEDSYLKIGDKITLGEDEFYCLEKYFLDRKYDRRTSYVYEKDGVIYIKEYNGLPLDADLKTKFSAIIDFNLTTGDILRGRSIQIDEMEICGVMRKVWSWEEQNGLRPIWIEGVGSIDYGTFLDPKDDVHLSSGIFFIDECYEDGVCIYKASEFKGSRYFAGVAAIYNTPAAAEGPIYDLRGIRVTKPVKGNIYIRDGRKFVY